MSRLMEQALSKIEHLPEEEQDATALIILRQIESEQHWDWLFAHPRSAGLLSGMADEALNEARAGRARMLNPEEL